jgi:hypothetical protein
MKKILLFLGLLFVLGTVNAQTIYDCPDNPFDIALETSQLYPQETFCFWYADYLYSSCYIEEEDLNQYLVPMCLPIGDYTPECCYEPAVEEDVCGNTTGWGYILNYTNDGAIQTTNYAGEIRKISDTQYEFSLENLENVKFECYGYLNGNKFDIFCGCLRLELWIDCWKHELRVDRFYFNEYENDVECKVRQCLDGLASQEQYSKRTRARLIQLEDDFVWYRDTVEWLERAVKKLINPYTPTPIITPTTTTTTTTYCLRRRYDWRTKDYICID